VTSANGKKEKGEGKEKAGSTIVFIVCFNSRREKGKERESTGVHEREPKGGGGKKRECSPLSPPP